MERSVWHWSGKVADREVVDLGDITGQVLAAQKMMLRLW